MSDDGPSQSRTWLAKEGYKPSVVPGNETEINSALSALLAKRDDTKPASRSNNSLPSDPLANLGGNVASVEGAWAEARQRLPQAVLRKPYGGPVAQAFDLTLDVVADESSRTVELREQLQETATRVQDLEAGKGDDVGEKLAALKKIQDEASWDAADRIDAVEATMANLKATIDKNAMNLKHQEEDAARVVAEMTAGIDKERRRNIQERFALAIVMSRLQELKESLDQNTEGDLELRASVEEMQRTLVANASSGKELPAALPALAEDDASAADEDDGLEAAESAELDRLNAQIHEITAASEEAEARMKEQEEEFIARERAVAALEAELLHANHATDAETRKADALAERLKSRLAAVSSDATPAAKPAVANKPSSAEVSSTNEEAQEVVSESKEVSKAAPVADAVPSSAPTQAAAEAEKAAAESKAVEDAKAAAAAAAAFEEKVRAAEQEKVRKANEDAAAAAAAEAEAKEAERIRLEGEEAERIRLEEEEAERIRLEEEERVRAEEEAAAEEAERIRAEEEEAERIRLEEEEEAERLRLEEEEAAAEAEEAALAAAEAAAAEADSAAMREEQARAKEERAAEKALAKQEKEAAKERARAEKEAQREALKAEKEAQKEAQKAEKEAQKAERAAQKSAQKAEKERARAEAKALAEANRVAAAEAAAAEARRLANEQSQAQIASSTPPAPAPAAVPTVTGVSNAVQSEGAVEPSKVAPKEEDEEEHEHDVLLRASHDHDDEELRALQAEFQAQKAANDAKAAKRAELEASIAAHKREVAAQQQAKEDMEKVAQREWHKLKNVTKLRRNQMLSLSRSVKLAEPPVVAPPPLPVPEESDDEDEDNGGFASDGAAELEALEKRLAALDAQGKARVAQANLMQNELASLETAAATAQAARELREARMAEFQERFRLAVSEKADRRDLSAVSGRVSVLEQQRDYEEGAGLSMNDVKERLEALERATADLRVRTVLEERVHALAETKGDAALLSAQLQATREALKNAVQEVRTEDRRRVDASLQSLTQRQADHARDFSQFSTLVEQDLAAALTRAKETAHAASTPQLAAALKLHVNATVAEAATAQEAALQRQEAQLRSLKAGIQGGPDASQVRRLVGSCMESALATKTPELKQLTQMVNDLKMELQGKQLAMQWSTEESDETISSAVGGRGQGGEASTLGGFMSSSTQPQFSSTGVLGRDEARALIAQHVENALSEALGQTLKLSTSTSSLAGPGGLDHTGSQDHLSLGSSSVGSLPPLPTHTHHPHSHVGSSGSSVGGSSSLGGSSSVYGPGSSVGGGGSSSVREQRRFFLTEALKGNGGMAQATPQPQGQRWRPTHRKRALEHMKPIFAGAQTSAGGDIYTGTNSRSNNPAAAMNALPGPRAPSSSSSSTTSSRKSRSSGPASRP